MEVVASLSQGRTAAAQCGLFTHKSVPVIFEPPCTSSYRRLGENWFFPCQSRLGRGVILILIYLLTAIGLTAGGSSTVHIYIQTIHRTTQ